ncbi:hypothetical protein GGI07_005045 [Coemansia sp. Benny D115]|nr:hypothetical protein GGI07_005045 [Coemansia sp. Benny D115]
MDECFAMLIPDIAGLFDDFDSGRDTRLDNSTGNRDEEDIDDEELLAVMAVNRHNINIEFNPDDPFEAEESDANRVVFDALRERLRLCVRFHQPRVQLWRDKLMRVNLTDTQNSEKHDILLGIANRLYQRIDDVILKCRDLKIDPSFTRRDEQRAVCGEGVDDGEADEDDEFEEVTDTAAAEATERLRATMAGRSRGRTSADPKKKNAVFSLLGQPVLKSDPTYIDRSRFEVLNRNRPTPSPIHERTENDSSNPIEDRLRETAPVIPFGPDLLYWDVNSIDTNTTGLEIRHRFLGSAREAPVISGEAIDRLRMRAVDYDTLAAARGIVIPSKRPIKAFKAAPQQSRGIVSIVEAGLLLLSVLASAWIVSRESELETREIDHRLKAIAQEIRGWSGTYAELRTPKLPTVTTYLTIRDGEWYEVPTLLLVEGDVIALSFGETAPCSVASRDGNTVLGSGDRLDSAWTDSGDSSRTLFDVRETPLKRHLELISASHRHTGRSVLQNQICRVIRPCVYYVVPGLLLAALIGNAVIYGVANAGQRKQYGMAVEVLVGKTAYVLFPLACTALWPVYWILARLFASSSVVVLFDTLQRSKTEYEDTEDIDEFDVEALPPTKDIEVGMAAILGRMRWMWSNCDFRNLSRSSSLAETLGNITVICSIDKEGTVSEPQCAPAQIVVPDSTDHAILDLGEHVVHGEKRPLIVDEGWQKYLPGLRALGLSCSLVPKRRKMRRYGLVIPAQETSLKEIGRAVGFGADDLARFTTERELVMFLRTIHGVKGDSKTASQAASLTATLVKTSEGSRQVFVDGEAQLVLSLCMDFFDGSAIREMDDSVMAMYYGLYQNAQQQDLQCLAFSYRPAADSDGDDALDACKKFTNLDHAPREAPEAFVENKDGETRPPALDGGVDCVQDGEYVGMELPFALSATARAAHTSTSPLGRQVFLGLVTFAYEPKIDVCDFIEDLGLAGIRFVHFSAASGRQAKSFGERLGLETDWNTCIVLSADDGAVDGGYIEDHDIKARLPRGIENIRPHLAEVDDIPLQISLFAECTPNATREMVRIFQENGDLVCCIGSALADSNTLTFSAADLAVGVEPVPQFNGAGDCTNDGSISTAGALSTQFALGAALNCLPCPLFLQHDTSLYTLMQVFSEARHLIASLGLGATLLIGMALAAAAVNLVSGLCLLPPALSGAMLLWVLWGVAPLLASSLLFAPRDAATMSTMPVKNHMHIAEMPRFVVYGVVRMLPPVGLTLVVYATTLRALTPISALQHGDWRFLSIQQQQAVWGAQTFAAAAFIYHCVCVSMTMLHRTRLSTELQAFRCPVWIGAAVICLCVSFGCAAALVLSTTGSSAMARVPWYTYVIGLAGPLVLLPLQDACKMHDRKRWTRLQKLAKLEFNTKLGLHSPL